MIIWGKFLHFCIKTYVVGTHQKLIGEMILMSTHNICFHGEIRKIIHELLPSTTLLLFISNITENKSYILEKLILCISS